MSISPATMTSVDGGLEAALDSFEVLVALQHDQADRPDPAAAARRT